MTPAAKTAETETSEAKLDEAECRDELLDSELDTVTGGTSFQWGIGRAIGTAARGAGA